MAELSIGIISLAFEVFAGVIKAYQMLSEARGMPKELQYLRVRLKTEQFRLLDWAQVVQLGELDESLVIGITNKAVLLEVLEQQRTMILKFGRYDERQKLTTEQLLVEDRVDSSPDNSGTTPSVRKEHSDFHARFPHTTVLLSKCLDYIESTRKWPTRLRWVSCDKAKMETLVSRLSKLNDFLKELLTSAQLETLLEMQVRTNYQIMLLNTKVDQLVEISASRNVLPPDIPTSWSLLGSSPTLIGLSQRRKKQNVDEDMPVSHLSMLAQIKALRVGAGNLALRTSSQSAEAASLHIPRSSVKLLDQVTPSPLDDQRVEAILTENSESTRTNTRVWVEWKYLPKGNQNASGDDTAIVEERLRALAVMLSGNGYSEHLRAPQCRGYFRDTYHDGSQECLRFGLVFDTPAGATLGARPISLLHLLTDPTQPVPSMTARVALCVLLAECLERFHAVDWLHKSLRSGNIVFFPDPKTSSPAGAVDLTRPYIFGFDYTRPAKDPKYTEVPSRNPAHDLYRHPDVQGSGRAADESYAGFCKSHDVYSLGIVLLEVALWRPIPAIMGIDNPRKADRSTTMGVKTRLLTVTRLAEFRGLVGDRIVDAIAACLESPVSFGLESRATLKDPEENVRLQRAFYEKVVRELKSVQL